jgi:hypothetical protein
MEVCFMQMGGFSKEEENNSVQEIGQLKKNK